jgi:hypothetical protein
MSPEQKLLALLADYEKTPLVDQDPTEEVETSAKEEAAQSHGPEVGHPAVTLKNIFRHPDAHPIVLDLLLLKKYGPDWYGWEAEVLQMHVPQDFGGTMSELVLSKIQAIKTLHLVDFFWHQWEIFCWCTMPFNGIPPDFEIMQVPTVAQCMVSVDIANQLRDDVEWSSEIEKYLEVVHRHDGIFVPQEPLDFVHVDTDGLVVDPKEIMLLWPAVKVSGKMPTAETVTAEQLRRMLIVRSHLEDSKKQLREQLRLVSHAFK